VQLTLSRRWLSNSESCNSLVFVYIASSVDKWSAKIIGNNAQIKVCTCHSRIMNADQIMALNANYTAHTLFSRSVPRERMGKSAWLLAGVMHRDRHFEMNHRMLFSKAYIIKVSSSLLPALSLLLAVPPVYLRNCCMGGKKLLRCFISCVCIALQEKHLKNNIIWKTDNAQTSK